MMTIIIGVMVAWLLGFLIAWIIQQQRIDELYSACQKKEEELEAARKEAISKGATADYLNRWIRLGGQRRII